MALIPKELIKAKTFGQLILVTGPTRSGKSDWAEALALKTQQPVLYIATSQTDPDDLEWQARIAAHRDRRPSDWMLWEVPQDLTTALSEAPRDHCILIDSLGTWLANTLEQSTDQWQQTQAALLEVLQQRSHQMIFVAEEVGWGVVPAYPAGRLFCDRLGELVRRIGVLADRVYLVTAGYALDIKQLGEPVPQDIKEHQALTDTFEPER
jgi:adenosylcobinamide kinase / adenosylcobinamide-phosphate guanylyltransferase